MGNERAVLSRWFVINAHSNTPFHTHTQLCDGKNSFVVSRQTEMFPPWQCVHKFMQQASLVYTFCCSILIHMEKTKQKFDFVPLPFRALVCQNGWKFYRFFCSASLKQRPVALLLPFEGFSKINVYLAYNSHKRQSFFDVRSSSCSAFCTFFDCGIGELFMLVNLFRAVFSVSQRKNFCCFWFLVAAALSGSFDMKNSAQIAIGKKILLWFISRQCVIWLGIVLRNFDNDPYLQSVSWLKVVLAKNCLH